jgi:hypothetical protein
VATDQINDQITIKAVRVAKKEQKNPRNLKSKATL